MKRSFVFGLVVGWLIIVYGAVGLLRNADVTQPAQWVRWFLGAGVAHDFVIAPIAVGIGWLTGRVVPERARVPVRLALAASALLLAFTWPYVRGYGVASTNPSAVPLDYGRSVIVALVLIWLTCAAGVIARTIGHPGIRARRSSSR